jgi:hypothetical protein
MQFACFRAFKILALRLQNPCTDPCGIQGEPCGTVLSSSFSVVSVTGSQTIDRSHDRTEVGGLRFP